MLPKNENEENIKLYPTMQEFEAHIPGTVEILTTRQSDKIYLVGTSHFSKKSCLDVSFVIRNVKPDGLVLELCSSRLHFLYLDEETLLKEILNLNVAKVMKIFKEHGITKGMFYLSFAKINAKITKQLGVAPGGECRRAVEEIIKFPCCKIFLGDRPLRITIDRGLSDLSLKQKLKFLVELYSTCIQKFKITEEHIDVLKRNDSIFLEIKKFIPSIYRAFVSERDYILAHSITIAVNKCREFKKYPVVIVGLTGMGHVNGIASNFGSTNDKRIKQLMKTPAKERRQLKLTNHESHTILANNKKGNIGATFKCLFFLKKYLKKFK